MIFKKKKKKQKNRQILSGPRRRETNLFAFLLLPVLPHCLTAFSSDNGQVRSGVLDWNHRLWLQEVEEKEKFCADH